MYSPPTCLSKLVFHFPFFSGCSEMEVAPTQLATASTSSKALVRKYLSRGESSTYFMFHLAFPSPELFMSYLSIHMSWGVTVAQLVEQLCSTKMGGLIPNPCSLKWMPKLQVDYFNKTRIFIYSTCRHCLLMNYFSNNSNSKNTSGSSSASQMYVPEYLRLVYQDWISLLTHQ